MSVWTEKNIETLKNHWGTKTAREIAELIPGSTRNSIIGKAARLNLSKKIKNRSAVVNQNSNENSSRANNPKQKRGRKSKFASLIIEKDFEPENPKKLEELTDNDCKYPIGHPDKPDFYFCGRSSLKDFSYCKLHLLYSYQSRAKKEETANNEEEVAEFIEKKIKSA
jgi:GcrA cell cycle regulator